MEARHRIPPLTHLAARAVLQEVCVEAWDRQVYLPVWDLVVVREPAEEVLVVVVVASGLLGGTNQLGGMVVLHTDLPACHR
jgi:hypothetical protein